MAGLERLGDDLAPGPAARSDDEKVHRFRFCSGLLPSPQEGTFL
jgi:hypothetical protein